MILGMSIAASVTLHTVISVVALLAGLVVAGGMLGARALPGWTALFLLTTLVTDVTGFFLPADRILPSHVVGGVSLVAVLVAAFAYYPRKLAGGWRAAYVTSAMLAAYLNAFVLVAQLFVKVPAMHEIAPTQSSPAFGITQLVVLALFVGLGVRGMRAFHPVPAGP